MITINLIPEGRRAPEGTPLPRFLTMLGGVVGFCLAGVALASLLMRYRPAVNTLERLQVDIQNLEGTVKEIDDLDGEIRTFRSLKGQVLNLYRGRRTWAPVLSRLRERDLLPPNVWYSKIELKKVKGGRRGREDVQQLAISGFARGQDEEQTSPMFQAASELVRNLEVEREGFSEVFDGPPDYDGGTLTDLPASKEVQDAPRKAVAFKVTLKVAATKKVRPPSE